MGFDASWAALIGTVVVGTVSIGTRFADDPPPIQSISGDVAFEVYQGDEDAGHSGELQWSKEGDDTWDAAAETASDEFTWTEEDSERLSDLTMMWLDGMEDDALADELKALVNKRDRLIGEPDDPNATPDSWSDEEPHDQRAAGRKGLLQVGALADE